jgi:pyrroline-5-carboxylate reductase
MENNLSIGFIGCGKMASAIIKGLLDTNIYSKNYIHASKCSNLEEKSKELGIEILNDNKKIAKISDVIFIATKPNQVENVLKEIKEEASNKLIVSIAAGIKIEKIENICKTNPVIRVMPNAPLMVKEGISALVKGTYANDTHINIVKNILEHLGKCIITEEKNIDIVTAISGSGPAFFYKVIHEIALAGQNLGLSYNDSLLLAEQTCLGSAKLMLNSTLTPTELISNIATKGGCTEVGVSVMNKFNTENLFNEVINKTTEKAQALGK